MNIHKFIDLRPYLYHLTDSRNIQNILNKKAIFSTKKIVEFSTIKNKKGFLRNRRPVHETILIDGLKYRIRDQRPISLLALSKCLTDGWQVGDFIEYLNKRVYFWCTLERLSRHFDRYEHEKPCIIKCRTAGILQLNDEKMEYCRINSGATRPNYHLGGIAPLRGPDTFKSSEHYTLSPATVVEVTILDQCKLPAVCHISNNYDGPWKKLKLF